MLWNWDINLRRTDLTLLNKDEREYKQLNTLENYSRQIFQLIIYPQH